MKCHPIPGLPQLEIECEQPKCLSKLPNLPCFPKPTPLVRPDKVERPTGYKGPEVDETLKNVLQRCETAKEANLQRTRSTEEAVRERLAARVQAMREHGALTDAGSPALSAPLLAIRAGQAEQMRKHMIEAQAQALNERYQLQRRPSFRRPTMPRNQ